MVSEAMCVLEKYFPASFFDTSVHLTVQLADDALPFGPVRYRWKNETGQGVNINLKKGFGIYLNLKRSNIGVEEGFCLSSLYILNSAFFVFIHTISIKSFYIRDNRES